jgi:hypothetical protein
MLEYYDDKNAYLNLLRSIDNKFITKLTDVAQDDDSLFKLNFDISSNVKLFLTNKKYFFF